MTIYGQVSVTLLINWVAIGFEVLLALADVSVIGLSFTLISPFHMKFTQILESILLHNPHKAAVFSVGCASFSSTLFPFTQLSVNMLGYSTLWTASFFGNECLWLTLLVKRVNDCLLDNCQISSLHYKRALSSEGNMIATLPAPVRSHALAATAKKTRARVGLWRRILISC